MPLTSCVRDRHRHVLPFIEDTEIRDDSTPRSVSHIPPGGGRDRMNEVIALQVRYELDQRFNQLIGKFHEPIEKTEWPVRDSWFARIRGGRSGDDVLVPPRGGWAAFAPSASPIAQKLEKTFGPSEAESLLESWSDRIE